MEIMYSNRLNENFKEAKINGFYKDKNDLVYYLKDIYGLSYDDEWSVYKYLNSLKNQKNDDILDVLKSLNINENILDKKIKLLSTNEFKFVLLAYLILQDPKVYIFDYFEVGLSFKNRKIFVNLLKKLRSDGKTIIIISNNIGFLYEVCDFIKMVENRNLIYNGSKNDLFRKKVRGEPSIITFIRKANNNGANLLYTIDRKELIKDIYRSLK